MRTFTDSEQFLAYMQSKYGSANWDKWQSLRKQFYSYVQYPVAGLSNINFFGVSVGGSAVGANRQLTNMPKAGSFGQAHFLLKQIRAKYFIDEQEVLSFDGTNASTLYTEFVNGIFQGGEFDLVIGARTELQIPKPFLYMPPSDGRSQIYPAGVGSGGGSGSIFGYFYNLASLTPVAINADYPFDTNGAFSAGSFAHVPPSSNITITNPGTYKVTFSVTGLEANQMQLFVNGVAVAGTIYGSGAGTQGNVGFGIVTTVAANALLSIRNRSSAAAVTPQTLAGGTQVNSVNSLLIEALPASAATGASHVPFADLLNRKDAGYLVDPNILIEAEQNFEVTLNYPSGMIPVTATDVVNDDNNPLYVGIEFDGLLFRPQQ